MGKRMQTCPVCFGRGTVAPGFYDRTERYSHEYRPKKTKRETCKSCGRRGIVSS